MVHNVNIHLAQIAIEKNPYKKYRDFQKRILKKQFRYCDFVWTTLLLPLKKKKKLKCLRIILR